MVLVRVQQSASVAAHRITVDAVVVLLRARVRRACAALGVAHVFAYVAKLPAAKHGAHRWLTLAGAECRCTVHLVYGRV